MSSPIVEEIEVPLPHAELYGWKGFIALGVAFCALGAAAIGHMQVAEMVSTFIVGIIVILAAVLGFSLATRVRDDDTHAFWVFGAILYLGVGIAVLAEPFMGERLLSLAICAGLMLAGLSRLVAGVHLQCTPVLVSGAVTMVIATAIGVGWQDNMLWILAYALAGDFLVQGAALIVAGQQLHRSVGISRRRAGGPARRGR
jgi:uncharacterized membrane protein HdeD (DUF308 family)